MTGQHNRARIVARLARLIAMCQSHRYLPTLEELSGQLQVNPRTIRRDLNAIEGAGIPVPPRLDQYREVA